jgi:hypothetical protein
MPELNKRKGAREQFNRKKLEESVKRAGASEDVAERIASKIDPTKVKTSEEVRKHVIEHLKETDPKTAKRYEETRRLAAKRAVEAAMGTVRLHEETMRALGANPGDTIVVEYRGNKHTLRAETAPVERTEMHLHEDDLRKLDATEGTRLAARRGS